MENENLAIATVPVQPWGPLFTEDEALCTGTIFRDLEMSFFATEDLPSTKHAPATPGAGRAGTLTGADFSDQFLSG